MRPTDELDGGMSTMIDGTGYSCVPQDQSSTSTNANTNNTTETKSQEPAKKTDKSKTSNKSNDADKKNEADKKTETTTQNSGTNNQSTSTTTSTPVIKDTVAEEFRSKQNAVLAKAMTMACDDTIRPLQSITCDTKAASAALGLMQDLDFSKVIGGPLKAAIAAQSEAAESTLKFIQAAGVQGQKVVTVGFEFYQGGVLRKIQIPLLTLVPIPTFVIKQMDYEFKMNVKSLSSTSYSTHDTIEAAFNAGTKYTVDETKPTATEAVEAQEAKEAAAKEAAAKDSSTKGTAASDADKAAAAKGNADTKTQTGQTDATNTAKTQNTTAVNDPTKNAKEQEKKQAVADANLASQAAQRAATQSSNSVSMGVAISTKKDSASTQTSRYSVEATMDVRISAGQDDLPAGVLTLINVLNNSVAPFNPYGELSVTVVRSFISGDSPAIVTAKYLNEDGVSDASAVKCDTAAGKKYPNASTVQFTFTQPGEYAISAGSSVEVVKITKMEQEATDASANAQSVGNITDKDLDATTE